MVGGEGGRSLGGGRVGGDGCQELGSRKCGRWVVGGW